MKWMKLHSLNLYVDRLRQVPPQGYKISPRKVRDLGHALSISQMHRLWQMPHQGLKISFEMGVVSVT